MKKIVKLFFIALMLVGFGGCSDEDDLAYTQEEMDTAEAETGTRYHADKFVAAGNSTFVATAVYESDDTLCSAVIGQGNVFYTYGEYPAKEKVFYKVASFGFQANAQMNEDLWAKLDLQDKALEMLNGLKGVPVVAADKKFNKVVHSTHNRIIVTTEGKKFYVRLEIK